MNRNRLVANRRQLLLALLSSVALPLIAALPRLAFAAGDDTYDEPSILQAASDFLGNTTEGLAKVVERVFREQGRPNAYIRGQEIAGAVGIGLVSGDGELVMKDGARRRVYWSGPSIGYDLGADAAKVFTLVYGLPRADAIYQRFPGVDGSLYDIGGVGMNYQRRDGITLAPIRLGAGLRAGASVGYVHYRREPSLDPL